VAAVHYPGLPSHPDHATARQVLSGGFGGMLTLDLGSKARAIRFRRRVRVVTPAASLGGVESLVSLPLETSHAYASAAKRRADGVSDGLVRISVGIEDAADLAADLRQALR
jgi:cystathionine beta-lyase/cystathionine gamma-synthase